MADRGPGPDQPSDGVRPAREGADLARVRMAIPRAVLDRFFALHALRFPDGEQGVGVLYAEALMRGLRALEVEARPLARQRYIEAAEAAGTPLTESEKRRVVMRRSGLAFGERREGSERRTDDRGATTGRRVSDHEERRRPFLRRVRTMLKVGWTPEDIAEQLAAEGVLNSSGRPWTAEAIVQLGQIEQDKLRRRSWRPDSL